MLLHYVILNNYVVVCPNISCKLLVYATKPDFLLVEKKIKLPALIFPKIPKLAAV